MSCRLRRMVSIHLRRIFEEVRRADTAAGGLPDPRHVGPRRDRLSLNPAMDRDSGYADAVAEGGESKFLRRDEGTQFHRSWAYVRSKLRVKKVRNGFTAGGMVIAHGAVGFLRMPRKPQPNAIDSIIAPHPHANLAAWREAKGLTQENVARTFSVTNVTIHRWETGKAPVSIQNYFLLARLYGASSPSHLMFPPQNKEEAEALMAAHAIIAALPEADRDAWIAIGRSLSRKKDREK